MIDINRRTEPGDQFKLDDFTHYRLPRSGAEGGDLSESTLREILDIKGAYLYQPATDIPATHKAEGFEFVVQDGENVGVTDKVVPLSSLELIAGAKALALTELQATDYGLSRDLEEIIDILVADGKFLSSELLGRNSNKKAKRAAYLAL